MDKHTVKLYSRAYKDLDGIYEYIPHNLSEPIVANNMINTLEEGILSLEQFPECGAIRKKFTFYAKKIQKRLDFSQIKC